MNTSSAASCSNCSTVRFIAALLNVKQLSEVLAHDASVMLTWKSMPMVTFVVNVQPTHVSSIWASVSWL